MSAPAEPAAVTLSVPVLRADDLVNLVVDAVNMTLEPGLISHPVAVDPALKRPAETSPTQSRAVAPSRR